MTATYLLIALGLMLVLVFLILTGYGLDVMDMNPKSGDHVGSQGSPGQREPCEPRRSRSRGFTGFTRSQGASPALRDAPFGLVIHANPRGVTAGHHASMASLTPLLPFYALLAPSSCLGAIRSHLERLLRPSNASTAPPSSLHRLCALCAPSHASRILRGSHGSHSAGDHHVGRVSHANPMRRDHLGSRGSFAAGDAPFGRVIRGIAGGAVTAHHASVGPLGLVGVFYALRAASQRLGAIRSHLPALPTTSNLFLAPLGRLWPLYALLRSSHHLDIPLRSQGSRSGCDAPWARVTQGSPA